MNKFKNILIFSILSILIIGVFTNKAFAETISNPKVIEFESSPLFGENSFVPGQSVTKTIKFTNNTDISRSAYLRVAEVVNIDKLGDSINLVIKQGNIIIYNDNFSNFFKKGKINLPQVKVGSTNTISLVATFIPESNNNYQTKVMGFGLQAILEDVEELNDNTTVIGGSNGISVGLNHLIITNENAVFLQPQDVQSVSVSWNTNIPATSQVIYGLASEGPYSLDMTSVNFGYPYSTEEDLSKITNHNIDIHNLPQGTYVYRVVSKASPATIGYEHYFTVSDNNKILNLDNPNNNQKVLGASTENDLNESNFGDDSDKDLSGSVLGDSINTDSVVSGFWVWFIIILFIFIIFFIYYRYKKGKSN